jgi:ATP-dependent Lhr-like helicase
VIRGGRFVSGFTGEQFALPEALETLARVRRKPRTGERIVISGSDPLNLVGILTPGNRVPAVQSKRVSFVDGLPIESDPPERSAERRHPDSARARAV